MAQYSISKSNISVKQLYESESKIKRTNRISNWRQ